MSLLIPADMHLVQLAPALALLFTAIVTLAFALGTRDSKTTAAIALLGIVTAFLFNLSLFLEQGGPAGSFGLRFLADTPALAFNFLVLIGLGLAVLVSYGELGRAGLDHPEFYPLMLLSSTGAMVMAAAGDLITLVLGLEILSLPVYALSAWRTKTHQSQEAGMKYFLLGAFASAVLIYGAALLYGATGSFGYAEIVAFLGANGLPPLATIGVALVLVGLGFKAALAPFHQWAPDVYTGAPTQVTTFMSVVVKVAAFAGLLRITSEILPGVAPWLTTALAVSVALTLLVGNLSALMQRGVKRMLAYSAVAHAGYLGLALLAGGDQGFTAAAWYLSAYALMNVGAFAVLGLVEGPGGGPGSDDLSRFAGLGSRRPWLALAMTLFLLSLAGIPPLAGFPAKLLVFQAAIDAGYVWLAVFGILTSVVALVYYFRVIGAIYFRQPEHEHPTVRFGATSLAIVLAAAGTVLLGVLPGWWHRLLDLASALP